MASEQTIILISALQPEVASAPLTDESAAKASAVLQRNHEVHDIITNNLGHHNHIVHGILTAYALGADPGQIQKHFDRNASYQRPPRALDLTVVEQLDDYETFLKQLTPNQTEMYYNWREHFERAIRAHCFRKTLTEYAFRDDRRSRIMFSRLFAGTFHPLIHLGFALEFEQPAILAEALGQACIHPSVLDPWFEEVDAKASLPGSSRDGLAKLLDRIASDPVLSKSAHFDDPHPIYHGVFVRAPAEMLDVASQWQVKTDELAEKTAELLNSAAYLAGGAVKPTKEVKFDFFYMHAVTSAIFLPLFMKQDWISPEIKAKLLTWKGRYDLLLFASRGCPCPSLGEIKTYKHKLQHQTWQTLFARAAAFASDGDDGHAAKFVRGLYRGAELCKPYEGKDGFRIYGPMWLTLANMVMDSVEGKETRWVRGAGFEQAWKE